MPNASQIPPQGVITIPSLTPEELEQIEPTAENALKYFPPSYIGPTWQKDENGKWLLPEKTLGWEILGWVAEWLTFSDDRPFMCTPEQARFILWFYAIDHRGKFSYRKAVLQRMKGWPTMRQGSTGCRYVDRRTDRPQPVFALG